MALSGERRRVAVVMAGGSGERFWPLSRLSRPKQLLKLTGTDKSMLAEAVERLTPLIAPDDIYVQTADHLVEPIRAAQVGVPPQNIIAEPCKRNTAGCLCYATAFLLTKYAPNLDPGSVEAQQTISMAVVTADHTIDSAERFQQVVETALRAAETEHALATIGIVPSRPETGYGYIQISEDKTPLPGYEPLEVHPVTAFREKPDLETAQEFFQSGRFFWNGGMFFWNVADFMRELAASTPIFSDAVVEMARAMREGDTARVTALFDALPAQPIDTALMEHAHKVLVVPAAFQWDDVGAWPALDRTHPHDEHGNVKVGESVAVGCSNCIIYNETASGSTQLAVVGGEDLVVVVCDDAVLVASKARAQELRAAVEEMKRRGSRQI